MQQEPLNTDLVLGTRQESLNAVLGGIEGVKNLLNSTNTLIQTQGLINALNYGEEGKELIKQHLEHPYHSQFFIDMVNAGYSPQLTSQRFCWNGVSVFCHKRTELQNIIRATEIDVIWDALGKNGAEVYPAAYRETDIENLYLLLQNETNPEAISFMRGVNTCLWQPDPLKTIAQNFLDQLKNWIQA